VNSRCGIDLADGPYLLGVIGDPVAHSLSPALHQPALDRLGILATYERWHTTRAELPHRIRRLREPLTLGANVTVPHKLAVLELVDEVSSSARRAGAVNTIVNREGRLYGDNTDIQGFQAAVTDAMYGVVPDRALILGAGGAARAVVLALEALAVTDIVVANRSEERASQLIRDLAPAQVRHITSDDAVLRSELPLIGLIVNATSLGWHAGESPVDLTLLRHLADEALVADLTYRDTDLLLAAKARGLRTLDGLPMLVHQGARAFELFTGFAPPVPLMLEAASRARGGS
jgi:shikimate dehydrogenase